MNGQEAGTADKSDLIKITPTLFIGLGGSGKEVLLHFRRLMFEKYRMAKLPLTDFIWADTDISGKGLDSEPDAIDKLVDLKGEERFALSVSDQVMAQYYRDRAGYDKLFEWYPHELSNLKEGTRILIDGAGQIRPAGRLAFWHHRAAFKELVKKKYEAICEVGAREKAKALGFEPSFDPLANSDVRDIFIVASLAGGTGSGAFLQAAFTVRTVLKRMPTSRITGIFFLPTVFEKILTEQKLEKPRANGYAALKELEYYFTDTGRKDTTLRRSLDIEDSEYDLQSPFDMVYLIDRVNGSGVRYNDPAQPFRMVAESLALEFDRTTFAQKKRSNRSNQADNRSAPYQKIGRAGKDEVVDTMKFEVAYATFGLAGIFVDQDRIRNAAAFRLQERLCHFMMGKEESPDIEKDLQARLDEAGLTRKGFLAQLLAEAGGRTPVDTVWAPKVDQGMRLLRDGLKTDFSSSDMDKLYKLTSNLQGTVKGVEEQFRGLYNETLAEVAKRLAHGGMVQNDGDDWKLVRKNTASYISKVRSTLRQKMLDLLQDPRNYGIAAGAKLIEEAERALKRLEDSLGTRPTPEGLTNLPRPDLDSATMGRALTRYGSADQIPALFIPYRETARNATREEFFAAVQSVQETLFRWMDQLRERLMADVLRLYENAALESAEMGRAVAELKAYVGKTAVVTSATGVQQTLVEGLYAELDRYRGRLTSAAASANTFYKATKSSRKCERNVYFESDFDYDTELDSFLARQPRLVGKSRNELHDNLLTGLFEKVYHLSEEAQSSNQDAAFGARRVDVITTGMAAIWEAATAFDKDRSKWDALEAGMSEYSFEQCAGFRSGNSAEMGLAKSGQSKEHVLSDVALRAGPWAQESAESTNDGYQKNLWRGCSAVRDPEMDEIIQNRLGYKMFQYDSGSLVFYNELMALPCLYFGAMASMKDAYLKNIQDEPVMGRLARHTDRNSGKFRDVLPPSGGAAWARRKEAVHTVVKGVVLGALAWDPVRGGFSTSLVRNQQDVKLTLGQSIDEIAERISLGADQDKVRVQQQIVTLINKIAAAGPEQLLQYIGLLTEYLNTIYPQDGGGTNIRNMACLEARNEALERLTRHIPLQAQEELTEGYRKRIEDRYLKGAQPIQLNAKGIPYTDWASAHNLKVFNWDLLGNR